MCWKLPQKERVAPSQWSFLLLIYVCTHIYLGSPTVTSSIFQVCACQIFTVKKGKPYLWKNLVHLTKQHFDGGVTRNIFPGSSHCCTCARGFGFGVWRVGAGMQAKDYLCTMLFACINAAPFGFYAILAAYVHTYVVLCTSIITAPSRSNHFGSIWRHLWKWQVVSVTYVLVCTCK